MNARHSIHVALLFAVITSAPTFAQGPASAAPEPRFYIAALGGGVSRSPTDPVFGVEVAQHLGQHAQAYATLSYFANLMGPSLRNALDATAAQLSALTGDRWALSGRDRGLAFVVGGKYVFGSGTMRPYLGVGAGSIHLKRTVFDARVGDVTQAVFNDFDLGDADLSMAVEGITRPLAEAAIGVGIGAGRTHVDVGYRYRTVFRLASKLDFSQVTVGIGYRF